LGGKGQLFCNDEEWAVVIPMCTKGNCGDAFNQVVREYGIPELGIHTDNAGDRCIYRVGENPEALSHQANLY